jgi:hypothetical protein
MNSTIRLLPFYLLIAFGFYLPSCQSEVIPEDARTNFEWFSQLGFPDVKDCQYVRVVTGWWGRSGTNSPQNRYENAFLLTNNPSQFVCLTLDLFKRTLTKSTNGMPEYQRVGFNELNLKSEADALLDAYASGKIPTVTTPELDERISKRVSMFVFAWACWRNGLNPEAEKLCKLSKTLRYGIAEVDTEHFQLTLEQEISYAVMWRAIIDFGNTSISRPQLLQEFQNIVANYPHSDQQERAKQTVAMLERMITEDEAHAKRAPTNLEQLPVEDRVRELIFRLRDQHGEQPGQPAWVDIFDDWRGQTNSSAHQLVRIGYPAVPQLIAALEDPTFTRSVGYWRDFTFSHFVLTASDCAREILGRITGKYFYVPNHTAGYMSTDGKVEEAHKLAEAWWAEFQKKGEKQMLVEGVEAGDDNTISEANRLVAHYPDAASAALVKGIRATTGATVAAGMSEDMRVRRAANIRKALIGIFQKCDSNAAQTFLRKELHEGNDGSRVSAAEVLVQSNKDDVIKTMIQEWQNSPDYKADKDQRWTECARFLASVDSPEAIQALGRNFQARPLNTRKAIVYNIGEGGTLYGEIRPISERSLSASAIEGFLVERLEDTEQPSGDSGSHIARLYRERDARICDLAGYYLNQLWPSRYHFVQSYLSSLKISDQERVEFKKIWQSRHP